MRQAGGRRGQVVARWGPVALVLAILLAGVAAYQNDLGARWFGTGTASTPPDPDDSPAAVPPPAGLDLPLPATPTPVAQPVSEADEGQMAPGRVRRLLTPLLADPDLGRHVVAGVADLSTGDVVFHQGRSAMPASTTKLLTATAALHVLGGDHRFTTRVVLEGQGRKRRLVLIGGGDPYLASKPADPDEAEYPERADLRTLARQTVVALQGRGVRRPVLAYDDSLFSGADGSARWEPGYLPSGVVAPIRALWVDEGRPADGSGRVEDPSSAAATAFAQELRAAGLVTSGPPVHATARAGARPLTEVESAPLWQIVERTLTVSDNEAAEVLAHQVGLATVGVGSFTGGVRGTERALAELGVPLQGVRLYDGSGLSRSNVLTPGAVLEVLRLAAAQDHPELRPVVTGLPVAGFTGSLAYRFERTPPTARGRVRAKTGTLTGTSALAGIATDQDGTSVAFFLAADRVALLKTVAAQDALDAAAAALAGCHCSVGSSP